MPVRSPSRQPDLSALEARIGYTFEDAALLRLALTHRSYTYEAAHGPSDGPVHANDAQHRNAPGTDNEQLEFLGDAVLGLLVSEVLLREFPDRSEGELTRLRAALVSRTRMAEFGRALSLGEHILLGKGVEQTFGRERPALLANAAEAVLAAIFLDAQRAGTAEPLSNLRRLLHEHLLAPDLPQLREALAKAPERGALRDAKTLLQELVQAQSAGKLRYVDLEQSGPPHDRSFTVEVRVDPPPDGGHSSRALATGEGRSKKDAQQAAAALALAHWPEEAPDVSPEPKADPTAVDVSA